jgi:hypothetical protein
VATAAAAPAPAPVAAPAPPAVMLNLECGRFGTLPIELQMCTEIGDCGIPDCTQEHTQVFRFRARGKVCGAHAAKLISESNQ